MDASPSAPFARSLSLPGEISSVGLARGRRGLLRKTSSDHSLSQSTRRELLLDLPYIALPGLESRVSSRSELSDYMELHNILPADEPLGGVLTWPLLFAASVSALGAFVCGFHLGDLNTPAGVLREELGIPPLLRFRHGEVHLSTFNDMLWSLCVSTIAIGALIGTLLADRLSSWRGRRFAIGIAATIFLIAAALHACATLTPHSWCLLSDSVEDDGDDSFDAGPFAPPLAPPPPGTSPPPAPLHNNATLFKDGHRGRYGGAHSSPYSSNPQPCIPLLTLLITSRTIAGIAVGISSSLLPVYLGELAPLHLRGSLGAAVAVASTIGVAATHLLGLLLSRDLTGRWLWTLHPLIAALLAGLQLLMLRWLPESPVWLLSKGRVNRAARTLGHLRGVEATNELVAEELGWMAMSARALCEQEVNGTGGPAAAALQQGIIAGGKRPGGYQPPSVAQAASVAEGGGSRSHHPQPPPPPPPPTPPPPSLSMASFESVDLGASLSYTSLGGLSAGNASGEHPPSSDASKLLARHKEDDLRKRLLSGPPLEQMLSGVELDPTQRRPRPLWGLFICCALMWAQQLSGVGITLSFSSGVLRDAGVPNGWVLSSIVLNDIVGIGVTALATRILDITGRRPLLIGSLAATSASLVALTAGLKLTSSGIDAPLYAFGPPLACAALALHAAAFGVGLGPVPWLLPNELLDVSSQRYGGRLTAASHWLASASAAQSFLPLCGWLGLGQALLPNVLMLLCVLLGAMLLTPEPRGKTIAQLQAEMGLGL